jgi:uncharacterized glyoxalase superfamily protein PhnB
MNNKLLFILALGSILGTFCMNDISKTTQDIYPMPLFCTLMVEDVAKSAEWYAQVLGFGIIFDMYHPSTKELIFVHLRREKYQDILLVKGLSEKEKNSYGIAVTLQAGCDIDVLANRARENNAAIIQEPHDTPWNTREVTFQDLDGYRVTLTNVIERAKTMQQVMQSVFNKI